MLWSNDRTDRLSRQPASPTSGEFEARIMGARTEEMDGGTLRLTARLKEHGLGLDIKTFPLERNGAALRACGEVLTKNA